MENIPLQPITANPESISAAIYDASYEPVDESDSSSKIKLLSVTLSNISLSLAHSSPSLPLSIVSSAPSGKWVNIPSPAYGRMHEEYGHDAFTKCFRLFLDESNYPIDFHCIQGADRTGCLAYILGALLGVSDRELECDWEVTAFVNPNPHFAHAERYDKFVEEFKKYPGSTSRERVEAYVRARGFSDADIEKFRSIMLEK